MKTILATTYAVNPYKGSEDAMGWNYIYQIAKFNKVIAITRENNQSQIEKYMFENPDETYENISFQYFDLPKWMRFWKKGSRGALLYFYLWQRGVVSFVKELKLNFDIAHNLNFHNDWTPSFLWKLNKPFVWGPIGHHPLIPSTYTKYFDLKDRIKNMVTWVVKKLFWTLSPSLKNTVKKADHILCMNNSVSEVIDLNSKSITVYPSVATQDHGCQTNVKGQDFNIISAGRFVPLKGFDITIRSYAKFLSKSRNPDSCKLTLVGDGPERIKLIELTNQLGIKKNVQFISWIERSELMKKMKRASVFLFPSHEGAGMVVPEALSFGLPCIVLDNCGPGQFVDASCGYVIPKKNYEKTIELISDSLLKLESNPAEMLEKRRNARALFEKKFHWDRRGEMLSKVYESI